MLLLSRLPKNRSGVETSIVMNVDAMLDGAVLGGVEDVHRALATALDFGPYYGYNLAALWDRLRLDVPRPVTIRWINSALSRQRLGADFDAVVRLFEDMKREDDDPGLIDRFSYSLE